MRVIAGELGGRRLIAPAGTGTRPTSDRVKEALFSIVGPLDGERVLDLFAGSGALAIEALSRGAARATCVDDDRGAAEAITANASVLGLGDRLRVVRRGWRGALQAAMEAGEAYDLVLADPPYDLLPVIAEELGWPSRRCSPRGALWSSSTPGVRSWGQAGFRALPSNVTPRAGMGIRRSP